MNPSIIRNQFLWWGGVCISLHTTEIRIRYKYTVCLHERHQQSMAPPKHRTNSGCTEQSLITIAHEDWGRVKMWHSDVKLGIPSGNLNGCLDRKVTHQWFIFHRHVWLPEGIAGEPCYISIRLMCQTVMVKTWRVTSIIIWGFRTPHMFYFLSMK